MPVAPYGSWKSPIGASLVASAGVRLDALQADGPDLYWLEGRPTEGGRNVLVRHGAGAVTPEGFNVRTRAHEYGGGACTVHRGTAYFCNYGDQRLYRQRPGERPQPITPEAEARYADACVTADGRLLICVRERHETGKEAINELVFLPTDGTKPPAVIAAGYDFYSSPRLSPDGQHLAWLCWNHPNMPWDGTELWRAGFGARGVWGEVRRVAGGRDESIFQPDWSTTGRLFYVSDRDGWWKLYYEDRRDQPVVDMEAEFGRPQWVFGERAYAFLPDGRIAAAYTQDGFDHLLFDRPAGPLAARRLAVHQHCPTADGLGQAAGVHRRRTCRGQRHRGAGPGDRCDRGHQARLRRADRSRLCLAATRHLLPDCFRNPHPALSRCGRRG